RPEGDVVWIGGYWAYDDDRTDFLWVSGCWRTKPDAKEWVPGYWREVGNNWQWVPGFWTSVQAKGVTYYPVPPAPPNVAPGEAPVTVDVVVVGPRYVYTPYYAVRDTIVLDTLFVRPAYGAYYFGDYYGPAYVAIGFEPCVFYSRRHYEPIIVYERWHHREDPR